jgi:sugar/nucleoside kinase (ribokinase family)
MRSPKTVIIGHVCIDQNKAEHASYVNWGSSALYTARYFQDHFGCDPDVITTYGPDFIEYEKDFRLHPNKPTAKSTLLNENIMSGKEKERIRYSHNADQATAPVLTPETIALIEEAEILVIATLLPNYEASYVQETLSHARPSCLKVLIVQGYLRSVNENDLLGLRDFPEAGKVLPNFDIAVLSDDDHPKALELTQAWKKYVPTTNIVLTQGPQGASVITEDGTPRNIPTTPVAPEVIVDSVGCGDVFTAALTYHYFQNNDLASAIMAGHRAARRKLLSTNLDTPEVGESA